MNLPVYSVLCIAWLVVGAYIQQVDCASSFELRLSHLYERSSLHPTRRSKTVFSECELGIGDGFKVNKPPTDVQSVRDMDSN